MAEEIREYFNEERFVMDTYLQIQKDMFGLFDLEISLDELRLDPYSTLHEYLLQVLSGLVNLQNDKLAQFIYKVDLPENQFKTLAITDKMNELADAVLRREAQKVYLRRKLST